MERRRAHIVTNAISSGGTVMTHDAGDSSAQSPTKAVPSLGRFSLAKCLPIFMGMMAAGILLRSRSLDFKLLT